MIKLPLSFGRLNKLMKVVDFSYFSIKSSCTGDSTVRLLGCANEIFYLSLQQRINSDTKHRFRMNYVFIQGI